MLSYFFIQFLRILSHFCSFQHQYKRSFLEEYSDSSTVGSLKNAEKVFVSKIEIMERYKKCVYLRNIREMFLSEMRIVNLWFISNNFCVNEFIRLKVEATGMFEKELAIYGLKVC